MRTRRFMKWAGHYPPRSPAEWLAEGHVTCNIQCLNGRCDRRVDVRLETLPQDQPWSSVGLRMVCSACGAAGSVHNVGAYASFAVDTELYSELGYGELTLSLINMGTRNYYLSARVDKQKASSNIVAMVG
ncbi:hypothetical protein ABIB90_007069 [Bradyrhizobium sp. JR4.1]|uniref:hypothetical protein n=1 Tax=Bradyrhizobium sp. JR4.1 TaxID=3156372 RepID=UPI00055B4C14